MILMTNKGGIITKLEDYLMKIIYIYAQLTGYQNTGDEFEINDMDPQKLVNKLNLPSGMVSMMVMKEKEVSGVLIYLILSNCMSVA